MTAGSRAVSVAAMARSLKSTAPRLYWRARNGLALARWCAARAAGGAAGETTAYGAAFWDLHDAGDWDGFASVIVTEFQPRLVVDVGCGDGKLLAAIARAAPNVRAIGYDSSGAALERARGRAVEVRPVDLVAASRRPHRALADDLARCDLAISLETAEHLPPWRARSFVRLLARAPRVLFSAAQPLQGGTLHVNEQPMEYWSARFAAENHGHDARETAVRAACARLDLPWWYARNLQVFARRS